MVSAKASVMIYSDGDKKWLPSGSSPGISKVSIYHHATNNTFRVVGRKLQDMEVQSVIMCCYIRHRLDISFVSYELYILLDLY